MGKWFSHTLDARSVSFCTEEPIYRPARNLIKLRQAVGTDVASSVHTLCHCHRFCLARGCERDQGRRSERKNFDVCVREGSTALEGAEGAGDGRSRGDSTDGIESISSENLYFSFRFPMVTWPRSYRSCSSGERKIPSSFPSTPGLLKALHRHRSLKKINFPFFSVFLYVK